MTEYWFNNPLVLLENIYEFYPKKKFNKIQKINSLARLSIYYSIIIGILKLDLIVQKIQFFATDLQNEYFFQAFHPVPAVGLAIFGLTLAFVHH